MNAAARNVCTKMNVAKVEAHRIEKVFGMVPKKQNNAKAKAKAAAPCEAGEVGDMTDVE